VSAEGSRAQELLALTAGIRGDPLASAILCDIDGTLAPIADDPEEAGVPAEARQLLRSLAARYGLVGCISGRRASAARRIVGLDELHYAGNHGLETLGPGEVEPRLDPALAHRGGAARACVDRLDQRMLEQVGLRAEDKGPIQALHWRAASDEELAESRAHEIAKLVEREGLVPHFGRKVLEIRPVDGIHKGSAVRGLLADRDGISAGLYAGDDRTDLDAFRALRSMADAGELKEVLCVGVGSSEAPRGLAEDADVVVEGTDGFLEVLRTLDDGTAT